MRDPWVFPLVAALVVAVTAAVLVWVVVHNHRRTATIRQWAQAAGWTYAPTDSALVSRWQGRPFGVGRRRRARHVLTGGYAGHGATVFEYSYLTGGGQSQSTHTRTVVALRLPAWLPSVELTPEGVAEKLAKALGGQDIEVESAAFNARWRVWAADQRVAHAVVHPRMMERLMAPDADGVSLRVEGTDLLSWDVGRLRLDAVSARLALLASVAAHIPRHVWLDHGYDPDVAPTA